MPEWFDLIALWVGRAVLLMPLAALASAAVLAACGLWLKWRGNFWAACLLYVYFFKHGRDGVKQLARTVLAEEATDAE